jgi:adenine-specific DNA-methyltransferase
MSDGSRRPISLEERKLGEQVEKIGRVFARNPMVSPGWMDSLGFEIEFDGEKFRPPTNRHWATTQGGVEKLRQATRLAIKGNTLRYVRYFRDFALQPLGTVWNDTGVGGFVGDKRIYAVQTDTRAIARCLLMTTDPGDLVLDPTCGSGTTAYVAEQWGRRWITCDTSRVATTLAKQRLMSANFDYYDLAHPHEGVGSGFRYKTVPHVTLKSIANNPEIREGMTREQIDAAIARYAE